RSRRIPTMTSLQSLDFLRRVGGPLVATTLDGTILYWSSGARGLLGFSAEEMKLKNWWEHFPANTRARIKSTFAAPNANASFAANCLLKDKQSAAIPVAVHISTLLDENNSPNALLTICHELPQASKDPAVGSASPAEGSLEQSREAVYQARKAQAIGALAAGLAHDFNNL